VIRKLAHCKKEANALRAIERRMESTGETQVSLTDPDCRAMATTSKQSPSDNAGEARQARLAALRWMPTQH